MSDVAADRERSVRTLLLALVERIREGRDVADLLGRAVDASVVVDSLAPVCRADASIEALAVNGERVDVTMVAGETAWRVVFGAAPAGVIEWLSVYERPARSEGVPGGAAIVVNGPSGSGKSTLLAAMQTLTTCPLVVFDEPEQVGAVQPGYLIWRDRAPRLHRGYLDAIAALARAGNAVCLAAAGHAQGELSDALAGIPTVTVGLDCAFDVLVARERRSGRWAGIAAASLGIHDGWSYDLRFDTTDQPDPVAMARSVLARSAISSSVGRTSPNER